jgi:choline dehydrogenase-like flavoprotein
MVVSATMASLAEGVAWVETTLAPAAGTEEAREGMIEVGQIHNVSLLSARSSFDFKLLQTMADIVVARRVGSGTQPLELDLTSMMRETTKMCPYAGTHL